MVDFAMTNRLLPRTAREGARAPARVILHDHTRLPGRFFGRLTASVLAILPGR